MRSTLGKNGERNNAGYKTNKNTIMTGIAVGGIFETTLIGFWALNFIFWSYWVIEIHKMIQKISVLSQVSDDSIVASVKNFFLDELKEWDCESFEEVIFKLNKQRQSAMMFAFISGNMVVFLYWTTL